MSSWNVGDHVYDLKLMRLSGRLYTGHVRRLGRLGGSYVEWENNLGYEEFMYDSELSEVK